MASIKALASAAIASALIKQVIGSEPSIIDNGDSVTIELSEAQKKIVQQKISSILEAKPGEIRIDLVGILGPTIAKKFWWVVAAPFGLGALVGWIARGK
ncbi:MAG: hypothetical protein WBM07_17115 [Chitinivibrionales bacterium]